MAGSLSKKPATIIIRRNTVITLPPNIPVSFMTALLEVCFYDDDNDDDVYYCCCEEGIPVMLGSNYLLYEGYVFWYSSAGIYLSTVTRLLLLLWVFCLSDCDRKEQFCRLKSCYSPINILGGC